MTRKLLLVVAAFTMLFVVSNASAPAADAQITCTIFGTAPDYYATIVTGPCPGASGSAAATAATTGGGGSSAAAAAAATGAAATGSTATAGTTAPALAVTGVENGVLGYVGAGLVGFGALALGTARRRQSDLG